MTDDTYTFSLHTDLSDSLPIDASNVHVEVIAVDGDWVELRITCQSKQGHAQALPEN